MHFGRVHALHCQYSYLVCYTVQYNTIRERASALSLLANLLEVSMKAITNLPSTAVWNIVLHCTFPSGQIFDLTCFLGTYRSVSGLGFGCACHFFSLSEPGPIREIAASFLPSLWIRSSTKYPCTDALVLGPFIMTHQAHPTFPRLVL